VCACACVCVIPVDGFDYGGWDPTTLTEVESDDSCQFDSIDASALTAADFTSRYLLRSRPLLIRHAVPAASAWREALRRGPLQASVTHRPCRVHFRLMVLPPYIR
jgi:hypothetical protein